VYSSRMRSCLIPRQRWSLLAGWRFAERPITSHQAYCGPLFTQRLSSSFAAAAAATPVSAPSVAVQQQPTSRSSALVNHAHAKQTVDYTALAACCHELSKDWVPAKVEEVSRVVPRCALQLGVCCRSSHSSELQCSALVRVSPSPAALQHAPVSPSLAGCKPAFSGQLKPAASILRPHLHIPQTTAT
jgi:hypothetical protein